MTNAPSVNQMRFLSSSALAKADQLILAASCSAADAMADSLRGAPQGRRLILEYISPASRRPALAQGPLPYGSLRRQTPPRRIAAPHEAEGGASWRNVLRLPPAFSIAAAALLDAASTSKAAFAVHSPTPRILTPSRRRVTTPAFMRLSIVIGSDALSFPASIARWMRPRLTSLRTTGAGGLNPRLGWRRCKGIWPPSKPLMRTPERAVWPLPPRPACLPLPEPMPRPTRVRGLDDPGLSLTSLSFMGGDPYRPSTTRRRCATLAIMPRLAGVSATRDRRPIRLRPRPLSVSRCEPGRPMALPVCSSVMVLSELIVLPAFTNRRRRPRRPGDATAASTP